MISLMNCSFAHLSVNIFPFLSESAPCLDTEGFAIQAVMDLLFQLIIELLKGMYLVTVL